MITLSIIDAGRVIVCSHILLLIGLIVPRLRSWDRVYVVMIGTGALAYFLLPVMYTLDANRFLMLPLVVFQVGMTFWLWMFAHATRDPDFKPRPWHWLVLIIKVLITLFLIFAYRQRLLSFIADVLMIWHFIIPALFSLALTIAAVIVAGLELADELDNAARRLRQLLIYYGAATIITGMINFLFLKGPVLETAGNWLIVLLAMIILINIHVIFVRSVSHREPIAISTGDEGSRELEITNEDRALAARIEECFEREEFYRTEGLTVAMLAQHLEEKEYKIRVAINHALGYRNFNAFLNHYRIESARETLVSAPDLPVLNLSLDLGYRSLAGFNKAFKEITSLTPTEFRSRNLKAVPKNPS